MTSETKLLRRLSPAWPVFFLLSLGFFVFGSTGETPGESQTPSHSTTSSAATIVSLSPHITEMIFALGESSRLVGVTDYCHHPPQTKDLSKFGALMTLQTERLVAKQPDVIFYSAAAPGDLARLQRARIALVHLPTETIDDITSGLTILGRQLDCEDRATFLVQQLQSQLASLQQATKTFSDDGPPRVLLVLSRRPGPAIRSVLAAGPGTFLDELIRAAGGRNFLQEGFGRYPQVSAETLLGSGAPDVIIELLEGVSDATREASVEEAWRRFLGARSPTRIVATEQNAFLIPGPRVALAAWDLARLLHPNRPLPPRPPDPTVSLTVGPDRAP